MDIGIDCIPTLIMMMVIFFAAVAVGYHNHRYDLLCAKWRDRQITTREQLRAFFNDFKITPAQVPAWLMDGTSVAAAASWVQGSGPLSYSDLVKISYLRACKLPVVHGAAPVLPYIVEDLPEVSAGAIKPSRSYRQPANGGFASQHQIDRYARDFERNARENPFVPTPKSLGKSGGTAGSGGLFGFLKK